jgi:hypothetical protein
MGPPIDRASSFHHSLLPLIAALGGGYPSTMRVSVHFVEQFNEMFADHERKVCWRMPFGQSLGGSRLR